MDNNAIQYNILSLRATLGLSFSKFGRLFGNTSAPAALNWENGESIPPKSKLELLADFCGVSFEDFTTKRLSENELKVINSFYHYGDAISYLESDTIKKIERDDEKFTFSCDIFFKFDKGEMLNSFDIKSFFTYDPSHPSIIIMNFEPVFNSLDEVFLLDFQRLLGRYIHVSHRKHFEVILYQAMKFIYSSLTHAIHSELKNQSFPVLGVNVSNLDEYNLAYNYWKENPIERPKSNLLIFYGEYEQYQNATLLWPNDFFFKGGGEKFNDYIQKKYN